MTGQNPFKRPIAVTMGDPAGIGPLLAVLAWQQKAIRYIPDFIFIGDPSCLDGQAPDLHVIPVKTRARIIKGNPNSANAPAIINSIKIAVDMAAKGKVRAVVTNPIYKKLLLESGFKYPGHTDFLGALTNTTPVMMLANNELKVVPTTGHVPLKDISKLLTKKRIMEIAKLTANELEKHFDIHNPRMAFTGLNPHAGEEGALGDEEIKTIIPAIKTLQNNGYQAAGPFPADSAFTQKMRMKFDVFFAMTHDQALIPVKTLDIRKTVNITLGLPIIRTSPAHGTAFDLLKSDGQPDPESFIQALLWAERLSQ